LQLARNKTSSLKTHFHHRKVQVFPPDATRIHENAKVAGLFRATEEVALAALEQLHEEPAVPLGRYRSAVVPCCIPHQHRMALGVQSSSCFYQKNDLKQEISRIARIL